MTIPTATDVVRFALSSPSRSDAARNRVIAAFPAQSLHNIDTWRRQSVTTWSDACRADMATAVTCRSCAVSNK
jgi:hypothetical protein